MSRATIERYRNDGQIHDRSPLLPPDDKWDVWLDPELTHHDQVDALIASVPERHLTPVKVDMAVGNVRNDSPRPGPGRSAEPHPSPAT